MKQKKKSICAEKLVCVAFLNVDSTPPVAVYRTFGGYGSKAPEMGRSDANCRRSAQAQNNTRSPAQCRYL